MHTPLTSHAKSGLTGAGDGGSVAPEGEKLQFPAILQEGARKVMGIRFEGLTAILATGMLALAVSAAGAPAGAQAPDPGPFAGLDALFGL
jgi:hypothetical protein